MATAKRRVQARWQAIHTRKIRSRERNARERAILKQALSQAVRTPLLLEDGIAILNYIRRYPEYRSRLSADMIRQGVSVRRIWGAP